MAREPGRTALREALANYAATRIVNKENAGTEEALRATIARSLGAQAEIWPAVRQILDTETINPGQASIVQSVTEVLDMHTTRLTRSFDRLPTAVLLLLVFLGAASMGVAAYNAGIWRVASSARTCGRWRRGSRSSWR